MNASSLNTSALIRPAWTPATIAMMIIGFMLFWPLGLGMLAYILWGERLDTMKTDINRATDNFAGNFNRSFGCRGRRSYRNGHSSRTGNVAFDDWREEEISRLKEERNKLDEMLHEFDEHLSELRRAKDQGEFDEFMSSRKSKSSGKRNKSVPDSKSGGKGSKD